MEWVIIALIFAGLLWVATHDVRALAVIVFMLLIGAAILLPLPWKYIIFAVVVAWSMYALFQPGGRVGSDRGGFHDIDGDG